MPLTQIGQNDLSRIPLKRVTCNFYGTIFHTVPLHSVTTHVDIHGYVGHVTSSCLYRHNEEQVIDAVYTFPMPDNAAVYRYGLRGSPFSKKVK